MEKLAVRRMAEEFSKGRNGAVERGNITPNVGR